jgi:hypothetical protein
MKVLILRPVTSFLPEADAYEQALSSAGMTVVTRPADAPDVSAGDFDVVYRFAGFLRSLGVDTPEIHEYSSGSTGRVPRIKNLAKSLLSNRPAGRVFTEAFVHRQFHFVRRAPSIFRDIGVSQAFLLARDSVDKDIDVVYVGSISGRAGVASTLCDLASRGFKVAVAGDADATVQSEFSRNGIEFVRRLTPDEIPRFIARSTHGLNLMPNVYPLIHQTSSKVQEYLAAGLTVISNDYPWIRDHSRSLGFGYINLDDVLGNPQPKLSTYEPVASDVIRGLSWNHVLDRAGFVDFVARCGQKS